MKFFEKIKNNFRTLIQHNSAQENQWANNNIPLGYDYISFTNESNADYSSRILIFQYLNNDKFQFKLIFLPGTIEFHRHKLPSWSNASTNTLISKEFMLIDEFTQCIAEIQSVKCIHSIRPTLTNYFIARSLECKMTDLLFDLKFSSAYTLIIPHFSSSKERVSFYIAQLEKVTPITSNAISASITSFTFLEVVTSDRNLLEVGLIKFLLKHRLNDHIFELLSTSIPLISSYDYRLVNELLYHDDYRFAELMCADTSKLPPQCNDPESIAKLLLHSVENEKITLAYILLQNGACPYLSVHEELFSFIRTSTASNIFARRLFFSQFRFDNSNHTSYAAFVALLEKIKNRDWNALYTALQLPIHWSRPITGQKSAYQIIMELDQVALVHAFHFALKNDIFSFIKTAIATNHEKIALVVNFLSIRDCRLLFTYCIDSLQAYPNPVHITPIIGLLSKLRAIIQPGIPVLLKEIKWHEITIVRFLLADKSSSSPIHEMIRRYEHKDFKKEGLLILPCDGETIQHVIDKTNHAKNLLTLYQTNIEPLNNDELAIIFDITVRLNNIVKKHETVLLSETQHHIFANVTINEKDETPKQCLTPTISL